jgi:flagellar biosynthesis/type III secretory pathway protein FliH
METFNFLLKSFQECLIKNVQQVLQHEKEKRISIHCHSNESTFTQRAWEISDGKTCAVQL